MDKYIKMLIVSLSKKYTVVLVQRTSYSHEKCRLSNVFTLSIAQGKQKLFNERFYSKRDVVMELMRWIKEKRDD